MTAVLCTLIFTAILWLLTVLGAVILEQSGAKIAAALKGRSQQQPSFPVPARTRTRRSAHAARYEAVEWSAAA